MGTAAQAGESSGRCPSIKIARLHPGRRTARKAVETFLDMSFYRAEVFGAKERQNISLLIYPIGAITPPMNSGSEGGSHSLKYLDSFHDFFARCMNTIAAIEYVWSRFHQLDDILAQRWSARETVLTN